MIARNSELPSRLEYQPGRFFYSTAVEKKPRGCGIEKN